MKSERLSRDNLIALSKSDPIDLFMERIDKLERQNAFLARRVHDLERRLGSNSSNSGKPPSSDGLKKPSAGKKRTGSLRGKSARKSGGQHGHEGTTLEQVSAPDEIIDHHPRTCPNCRSSLSPENGEDFARRQVFDIPPPPPPFVTEHRAHACRCRSCGAKVRANFPEDVKAPIQYGDTIASLAAYLQTRHCIPEDRLAQIFSDIHKIRISSATLANLIGRKARGLRAFADEVKSLLSSAAVPVKIWTRPASELPARRAGCMFSVPNPSAIFVSAPDGAISRRDWKERQFTTSGHPIWRSKPCVMVSAMRICSGNCRRRSITTGSLGRRK